jgi:hypothetical protein
MGTPNPQTLGNEHIGSKPNLDLANAGWTSAKEIMRCVVPTNKAELRQAKKASATH